jgi:Spy/CpxP family protein refolding chaperone
MMQRQLNLSTDQTAQLRTIMGDERTKMEALRSNTSLSREDRGAQMMAIHKDGQAKIEAMLTPDQKTKYQAMEDRMRERGAERGRGPGGPGGPGGDAPPPPPQ